jgi:hypothetical protein
MKRVFCLPYGILLAGLVVAACGASAHYPPSAEPMAARSYHAKEMRDEGPTSQGLRKREGRVAGQTGGHPEPIQRKVIYTGRFTVDVYDVKESQKTIMEFIKSKGGYMEKLSANTLVLRIPSEHFALIEPQLKKLGRVDDNLTDIRAQDITAEYYDLELRLKTKHQYLKSLNKLLESAGKLKDKLAVQQEIARVVEEVERLEGRLRLLGNQVALATVTVTFRLAHSGSKRTFRLPWGWLDTLGTENLVQ